MNAWHRYLFGPVAAMRPRLFAQFFLAVVCLDIWLTFVHRGPNLGVGGFVVAHFQWLDEIQPLPTPQLYIAMMIVTSFCVWTAGLCGGHRLLIAMSCLLFSYGWMMSQIDSFQHHYLMSLILLCVAMFPLKQMERQNIDDEITADSRTAKMSRPRTISAWAYIVLGSQVGIVYFWTTVTKFDAAFLGGGVVERLTDHPGAHALLRGSVELYQSLFGTAPWIMMAVATIIMEASLAFGYFYAVGQDRRNTKRSTIICVVLWAMTLALHGGILLMPLAIGLFGYYMLVVGSVFLLPIRWLALIDRFIVHPLQRGSMFACRLMNPTQSSALCLAESIVAAGGIAALCWTIDLPGSLTAGAIIAGLLIGYTTLDIRGHHIVKAQQRIIAAVLFMALAGGIVFAGTLRQRVYIRMAYMQHIAGDPGLALKYYTRVAKHAASDADRAGVYNNLGDIMARLHDYEEAAAWYRIALEHDPNNGSCHANLALSLMTLRQVEESVAHYQRAIELGPTSAPIHYNYAFALQAASRTDEALDQYRLAVYHNPDMVEAHNNLAVLTLTTNRLDEAHHHLREVLRLIPDDVFTMNNLAWMLATRSDRDPADMQEALTIATRAAALTKRQNPVVLGTLAECYFALGLRNEAVQTAEEAIRVARASHQDSVEAQVQARLERYRK